MSFKKTEQSEIFKLRKTNLSSYNGFSGEQREKCAQWIKQEEKNGLTDRLERACFCCAQTLGLMSHAEDYSGPYGPHVYAYRLCFRCHLMLHCRFRSPARFKAYNEEVKSGRQYEQARNFGCISRYIGGQIPKFVMIEPKSRNVFDDILDGITVRIRSFGDTDTGVLCFDSERGVYKQRTP